jgi:hypothetical protein
MVLVGILAAAHLAFDEQVRALLERAGELAELSPDEPSAAALPAK